MCWNRIGSPSRAGSKMPIGVPRALDAASMPRSATVIASTGVASSWIRLVAYIAQQNSGSRPQVMPGQRIRWMVTRMLRPVMIDENPRMKTPVTPGTTLVWLDRLLYGGESVHPLSRPPVMRAQMATIDPGIQTDHHAMFSFWHALSLVPIMMGTKKLPIMAGIDGMRNKNSITTPWAVNVLL